MAIPVRNILLGAIVLLIGISPLWSFAAEQSGEENSEQLSYGPVVPDDTLAEIAIKLKGEGPWHYHRWMYALYLKNPDAFFGNNMNNLKMGAKLLLPSEDELDQIDLAEAFRAVKVHFYVFQNERQEKRESNEELLLR
ncbi:MAG: hypothetical protein OQK25_04885, partial [Gammaproteobacteria bacterium]|nr:hypothetical protein [Gammaproteobacteria bacterium]